MTPAEPARPPPVFVGLHVRFGDKWTQPTADYACRCGWTDSAEGPEAVKAFTATIHRIHRAECPDRTEQRD